jgi:monothiol glutaredoxin|tara:strand:+ start:887 stop:1195 length:309 start_codon:yes stop_codon:yes gene_type:complete
MSEVKQQLEQMISENNIILFMKGNPHQPQCGFSARVVEVLKEYQIEFSYMDILQDPEIRATLPSVSDWPTFPQLFVKGELIGGCDIITEMHSAGELKEVLVD